MRFRSPKDPKWARWAKVGHGPLLNANSLQHKDGKKWTAFQPETYTQEDTSRPVHFSRHADAMDPPALLASSSLS